jgi:hypothetical protein
MIKVIESKKGLDTLNSPGLFLIIYNLNLILVNLYIFGANNKA